MLNNSQGSQGNNDLQTAQNAIAILIDQISKARGVGRTIVIDKNWLNNQLGALQNSLPAAVHQAPGGAEGEGSHPVPCAARSGDAAARPRRMMRSA